MADRRYRRGPEIDLPRDDAGWADLALVSAIYAGSDGEATSALYGQLLSLDMRGFVALHCFRACKASERAPTYKETGRYLAYETKADSIDKICEVLGTGPSPFVGAWGWGVVTGAEVFYPWVVYLDLPTGQVSFRQSERGLGPVYMGQWDGVRNANPGRICRWVAQLLAERAGKTITEPGAIPPRPTIDLIFD